MQVVCGNCQLSFDAPDGASGLICPICRGPLRAQSAEGAAGAGAAAKSGLDWSGGDLDDLIAILSAPAVSARVEVLPASGDAPVGEVHLLAGGVADALVGGKSIDDALEQLREVKSARFRVDPRLPNPANGDMGVAGPESGTLEGRPLAQLMRYCEDYVISCSIEVWRGNENARVEYKRGEISGVTVGGIDAPERLAEVMQWASGNYRLVVPPLKLPATAPKRPQAASAAPVPAPAPSAQAARQASSTKTIFGMPIAEIAKAREAAKAAVAARTTAPMAAASTTAAPTTAAGAKPAGGTPAPTVVEPAKPAPAAAARPTAGAAANKTIFGVPAPSAAGGFIPGGTAAPPGGTAAPPGGTAASPGGTAAPPGGTAASPGGTAAPSAPAAVTTREREAEAARAAEAERKTGARKVSVPAPDVVAAPPAAAPPAAAARAETAEATKRPSGTAPAAVARSETTEPIKRPAAAAASAADKEKVPAKREAPVLVWAAVGVFFGFVLLGIKYLVGMFGH
jgi:hypothetical protein